MKNKTRIILLCIICVMCYCVSVFGSGLLQQIYVDLKPINIVINGENKNPPSEMQPMIYNDRTYVPLRYVAESLGKDVDWDGDTRTVYIGEHQPVQKEIFESFTGPVSKNWEMSGSCQADGPNGYVLYNGTILLRNFFPDKECDFTVETEVLMRNTSGELKVYLGTDINNEFSEYISLEQTGAIGIIHYVDRSNRAACPFKFEDEQYHMVKFDVINGQCILYIDNEYIHTFNLEKTIKPSLRFVGTVFNLRNVNVKLND